VHTIEPVAPLTQLTDNTKPHAPVMFSVVVAWRSSVWGVCTHRYSTGPLVTIETAVFVIIAVLQLLTTLLIKDVR
jgi:hypothetical protein